MWWIALIPFFAQALVIGIDEAYFHVRRGLPLWERIGHPIDTLSILICILFVINVPFSSAMLKIYVGLAVGSSLLVTKDEFVHKHLCPWTEHWLHALLFTLHPIVLFFAGLIWPITQGIETAPWIHRLLDQPDYLRLFLHLQAGGITLFLAYQIIYWNFITTRFKNDAKDQ
jgi:hypothetical protein